MSLGSIYRHSLGVLSFAALPLLFILVVAPTDNHLNDQSAYFSSLAVVLTALSCLTLLVLKSRNRLTIEDCLVLLMLFWLSANYYFISPVNAPAVYWNYVFLAAAYFALRIIVPEHKYLKYVIFLVVTCLLFYEALLGFRQALGLTTGGHGLYRVTGSFFNPALLGGYLASLMAVSFSYLLFNYGRFKECRNRLKARKRGLRLFAGGSMYALCALALAIGGIVFFSTLSRAAIIALSVSVLLASISYKPFGDHLRNLFATKKRRAIVLASMLAAAVVVFGGLYHIKKDSADGRLLIWKVSAGTVSRQPLLGSGLGTFKANYAVSQAEYFKGNPGSAYKSVAGAPEYAFNEYLLTVSELGIIGLALLLSLLTIATINLIKKKDPYAYGLSALGIFAFFSYPFSILSLNLLVVLYTASSANHRLHSDSAKRPSRLVAAALMLFGGMILLFVVPLYHEKVQKTKEWKQAAIIYRYDTDYAAKDYASLLPWHADNPAFLFEYGRALHLSGNYESSNYILTHGAALSADPMFYNVIGNNYKALGKAGLAEYNYNKAFGILPNRMYPKYLLMNLHKENGDEEKARAAASEVLGFEAKIKSSATEEMREYARILLEKTEFPQ